MLKNIRTDESGATIVEFGLLLPVILGSFMGVLQGGISMMAYNSLRDLTAETSRYALVQYQSSNEMTIDEIEADGKARAVAKGFYPDSFAIDVTQPDTQRIEGALELTITTSYKVPSVVAFLGVDNFDVSFSRPIFLIDEVDSSEDGSELDGTEDTGTDFGEGGTDEGGPGNSDGDKDCSENGNCDHDHTSK